MQAVLAWNSARIQADRVSESRWCCQDFGVGQVSFDLFNGLGLGWRSLNGLPLEAGGAISGEHLQRGRSLLVFQGFEPKDSVGGTF